jgi:hypothetical protein
MRDPVPLARDRCEKDYHCPKLKTAFYKLDMASHFNTN